MATRYPIPAKETRAETVVVNSRFICTIGEARSVDEAMAFIKRIKSDNHTASSHAYAFHVGFGASVTDGCNDGGEPSGTAGKPMLAVLQGSGLGDVVAVVSRWFGGTKLGMGGLVRAFSGSLKAALEVLPRTERVERRTFLVETPYPLYERLKLLVAAHHGAIAGEEFGAQVLLTLVFAVDDVEPFSAALRELSAGALEMLAVE